MNHLTSTPTKTEFKASNTKAIAYLVLPVFLLCLGLYLSYSEIWSLRYITGQLLLAIFFFQCFILLHETGHNSYFKTRFANSFFGNIFAFISFIPFSSWVDIHNLHHKWTGYRDKDPTTEGTVSPKFSPLTKLLVNISWLIWFPLFTIGYRIGNYWNIQKIKKHVLPSHLNRIYKNMWIQITLYISLFYFSGTWIIQHLLLGYFISLIISDVFILSQHSHIKIPIAREQEVKPIRYAEQIKYTRSISFSAWIARYIYFNFNLHELHHLQPGLPSYYLDQINLETPNKVSFLNYLLDAKVMSGMNFVFNTSHKKIGQRKGN
jgi:omega-6 fatty acid desaturase (delta-12 desaturase)